MTGALMRTGLSIKGALEEQQQLNHQNSLEPPGVAAAVCFISSTSVVNNWSSPGRASWLLLSVFSICWFSGLFSVGTGFVLFVGWKWLFIVLVQCDFLYCFYLSALLKLCPDFLANGVPVCFPPTLNSSRSPLLILLLFLVSGNVQLNPGSPLNTIETPEEFRVRSGLGIIHKNSCNFLPKLDLMKIGQNHKC
ncbi:hypothetical protein AMECASPLE_031746 [Ameca splendens]|uniref:Uncharacterized protein n=1 Tax=Ameca splendens TaxID=208324 RepID=A0ABV0YTE6_9TELE